MWAVTVLEGLVDWYKNFLNTLPLWRGSPGSALPLMVPGRSRATQVKLWVSQWSPKKSLPLTPRQSQSWEAWQGEFRAQPQCSPEPGKWCHLTEHVCWAGWKSSCVRVCVCVCVCRLCACERQKERECVEGWMKSLPARVGKSCHCKSSDHFWFGCSCFPLVIPSVVSRRRWKKPSVKSFSIRRPLNCVSSSEIRVCCTQSFQLIYSWTLKSFCPKMPKREGTIFFLIIFVINPYNKVYHTYHF